MWRQNPGARAGRRARLHLAHRHRGTCPGGGYGNLTRRWGWTADNVTEMDVVTAEGRLCMNRGVSA
jgi:hypothetical protein